MTNEQLQVIQSAITNTTLSILVKEVIDTVENSDMFDGTKYELRMKLRGIQRQLCYSAEEIGTAWDSVGGAGYEVHKGGAIYLDYTGMEG